MANNKAEKLFSKQIPTANCQCALITQIRVIRKSRYTIFILPAGH